jgi:hypothetical protein
MERITMIIRAEARAETIRTIGGGGADPALRERFGVAPRTRR